MVCFSSCHCRVVTVKAFIEREDIATEQPVYFAGWHSTIGFQFVAFVQDKRSPWCSICVGLDAMKDKVATGTSATLAGNAVNVQTPFHDISTHVAKFHETNTCMFRHVGAAALVQCIDVVIIGHLHNIPIHAIKAVKGSLRSIGAKCTTMIGIVALEQIFGGTVGMACAGLQTLEVFGKHGLKNGITQIIVSG